MTTSSEIETVVEVLADKIGVAAETLLPVGEELLRQISMRGRVVCLSTATAALVCIALLVYSLPKATKKEERGHHSVETDSPTIFIVPTVLSIVGIMCFTGAAFAHLYDWFAPMTVVLGI